MWGGGEGVWNSNLDVLNWGRRGGVRNPKSGDVCSALRGEEGGGVWGFAGGGSSCSGSSGIVAGGIGGVAGGEGEEGAWV